MQCFHEKTLGVPQGLPILWDMGVSENRGYLILGPFIIRILLFRVAPIFENSQVFQVKYTKHDGKEYSLLGLRDFTDVQPLSGGNAVDALEPTSSRHWVLVKELNLSCHNRIYSK